MEMTTRYAKLSPVFVELSKQATLGVYDTRNRLFAPNAGCDGTVGKFPSIPTTRKLKCRCEIEGLVLTIHHRPMSHLALCT